MFRCAQHDSRLTSLEEAQVALAETLDLPAGLAMAAARAPGGSYTKTNRRIDELGMPRFRGAIAQMA